MKLKKLIGAFLALAIGVSCLGISASADTAKQKKLSVEKKVEAVGSYRNWDGVSNIAQFKNSNGEFAFAIDGKSYVTIVNTQKGSLQKKTIKLKKENPIFGTVTCDSKGNYYLVTGRENKTSNTSVKTIFVSKYDKNGKHIATVGDNGSSSLESYYGKDFYTQLPFDGGCCDAEVNGKYLAVNYARSMYSGHQSNSLFMIDIEKMQKVKTSSWYNSHSFAQRTAKFNDGFIFASEGDCYDRAFNILTLSNLKGKDYNTFNFWVEKGAFDRYDMYVINNNFAHMGGIAQVTEKTAVFVGTSVKSLSSKAESETEQLFIQIFKPGSDLTKASSYVTDGKRSGVGGSNGTDKVTDYGVKWLTDFDKNVSITNPQVAVTKKGKIVVLFEMSKSGTNKGVYYIVLDSKGKRLKYKCFSSDATLNPCEMPVAVGETIYWVSNKKSDSRKSSPNVYLNSLKID